MKKSFVTILLTAMSCCVVYAQEKTNILYEQRYDIHLVGSDKKTSDHLYTQFAIVDEIKKYEGEGPVRAFYLIDEAGQYTSPKKKEFAITNVESYWQVQIIDNVLDNIEKNGTQAALRSEMECDVLDYIYNVQKEGLIHNDPFLEQYIYSLIAKIAPCNLIDGRPCNVNLLIINDPSLNAGMYPNGTLVLHTGLLASLHTEDELAAIIAHEVAHFVLDHSIINVNKAVQRQKRAEFWAAMATLATAAAEVAVAVNNDSYMPGGATVAVGALSSIIASNVIDRLGMDYNHQQEEEADNAAKMILKLLNYDPDALATALARVEGAMHTEGQMAMYFASYEHPELAQRIKDAGTPHLARVDNRFEQRMSSAISCYSAMKYGQRRFKQVLPLVSQNIENNVAISTDYVLKAMSLLALHEDDSHNQEVLRLLQQAKQVDASDIYIYRAEVIAYLRLAQFDLALAHLDTYKTLLDSLRSSVEPKTGNELKTAQVNAFVDEEEKWVNDLIVRLKGIEQE